MIIENRTNSVGGKKIVVLGGGFAGLRIAYLLDKLGYSISLIEKSKNLGGMVQTFSHPYEGEQFHFDFGPHLFFDDYISEYRDLLGDSMISIVDRFCMCTAESIFTYPLRPLEILTRTNPVTSMGYLLDFLIDRVRPQGTDGGDDNLDAFLIKRFGRRLFNKFYAPYIKKCCGLNPGQVSYLWAKERENVSGKGLWENLSKKLRALLSSKTRQELARVNDPSSSNITAWYPRLGSGQLCDAMATALRDQDVYLNSTVKRVNIKDQSIQDVVVDVDRKERVIKGDYYISTLPLPYLFECLQPVSPLLAATTRRLKYRSVRLVCLIVDRERLLDCLEMFSMDRRHIFKRLYEPKAMSNSMSPKGKSSLCLEVCCNGDDDIAAMPPDKLASRCVNDLITMQLLRSPDEVRDFFVIEMPQAYPIYSKGFEQDRQKLLDQIAGFDNLLTCGRQGLFRYHAMTNEVMEMADRVVHFIDHGRDKRVADSTRSQWGRPYY